MIWQNPWALAALAGIAIPVVIHLLSRRNARVERFPTLRFLPVSLSAPVRRTRITDPLLMMIRVLIIAAAAGALAQPLWRTANRAGAAERRVVRAIVVDTSASTRRPATNTVSVRDSARRAATSFAADASVSIVIETATPAGVLQGVSSWLSGQNGRRELIVLSDFQAAVLDSIDLRAVAPEIAIRLERIPFTDATPAASGVANGGGITLFTSSASRSEADAARRAASPVPLDTGAVAMAIVYPDAPEREDLRRDAKPVTDARIADAIVRMRRDPLLASAMLTVDHVGAPSTDSRFVSVSRSDRAATGAHAAQAHLDGRETLLLFPSFDAATLASAALISVAARAVAPEVPPAEADPGFLADETLDNWERAGEPGQLSASESHADSDGRWLWLVALLLLGAETVLRRRPDDAATTKKANAG